MESVRQSCRPKHQVLTLKCYPRYQKGVAEVKPNPSELSYLLYYASTRRSKLTKVGGFLEKRVAKDVWRRRLGNVQVALHIISGLIEKVPRDLPIYVGSVLTIIESVLRSNEISLVEDSIATFETFCRHQDIAIISAEQGIAQKYREVVRLYASFADPSSELYSPAKVSPPISIRWRNVGLRAIRSIVSSESLAADGGNSLKIILPVILENLYSPDEDVLIPLKARLNENKEPEHDASRATRRMSAATVHTVDTVEADPALAAQSTADVDRKAEMDARLLALRCLERITVSGSNRGQMRMSASIIMRFISNKRFPRTNSQEQQPSEQHQDGNWATSLIELVANWCPVQVRFVILMTAMDTLFETSPTEKSLDSAFTILSVVDWLLKSSVNMIGLSVMDILSGLMQYASSILSPQEGIDGEKKADLQADSSILISGRRKGLLTLLEQCIGDLATHIYYGDQVADMTRAILRRFKQAVNNDGTAPSALATVHESTASPVAITQSGSEINGEKLNSEVYSHAAARSTALRAVKAIFVVANLRKSASTSETRNSVGIHVWEGTQGLLRDSDREVRYAYADAFLSWLRLETNNNDLKVRSDTPKYVKPTSKTEQLDKPSRRSTSAPGNNREIVAQAAQSSFLRLLHLAIYDAALDSASVESEILLLHLLMVSLVDNLGVNAVQFGLPMVLKLQDDLATSVDLGSSKARINIASLIHGYLLAISNKFNLESSYAGVEIRNEIERRQSKGQWLSTVRLPPTGLEAITDNEKANGHSVSSDSLPPFRNVEGLVSEIDESYSKAISSPPQSPPAAPARGFNFPVLSQPPSSHPQVESGLPSSVRDQMLSAWSRESCLAAVEKESAKTLSLSGSRGGTAPRNNANGAANGSPAGSATNRNRRMSVPEISRTPEHSSSRGSPVRVTELRRVLSVTNDSQLRKLSPLRGHVDASNISVISSGSESMVSGNYAISEMDADGMSLHQQEGQQTPDAEGSETPRPASAIVLSDDRTPTEQLDSLSQVNSKEIPPVPPIPTNLHIPGGFPNDSQRSLLIDRPSTAPDSRQSSFQGKSGQPQQHTRNKKSLNRNKSRSSNTLAGADFQDTNGNSALDNSHRDQLKDLLDGFLAPENSLLANGDRPTTASKAPVTRSYSKRRVSGGGIGRPPY